jgi:FKBP-type peptidyl-prolyl cis-trans isomerase FkpA
VKRTIMTLSLLLAFGLVVCNKETASPEKAPKAPEKTVEKAAPAKADPAKKAVAKVDPAKKPVAKVVLKSAEMSATAKAAPVAAAAVAPAGTVAPAAAKDLANEPKATATKTGLKFVDLKVGDGASPTPGANVEVHYTGWLTNGTKFDSSVDRGKPFSFPIGKGRVIKGWDEGVMSMKIGGKRKLIIPPELGYGARGAGRTIPPNATLVFEVELLGIK